MGDGDDGQLLRHAASGDEAATGALVRLYVRRATLLARQLIGDQDDAEDIVAEAFVIALERAATFRTGEPVGPWLYGIVRRVAARYHRRGVRRRGLLARWWPERRIEADSSHGAELQDTLDRLARIARELPEMQRQCFALVVRDGLNIGEVATMFGIAPSTVRQHVYRARATIRAQWNA